MTGFKRWYSGKWIYLIITGMLIFACACTKNLSTTAGKSNLAFSNFSSDSQAFRIYLDQQPLVDTPLNSGSTTGVPGNPYLQVLPGVHQMGITPDGTNFFAEGNISFTANAKASVFVYDAISNASVKNFILRDNFMSLSDTSGALRILNLSPDDSSVNLGLIRGTDTLLSIGHVYPGYRTAVNLAPFASLTAGSYAVVFYNDSSRVLLQDTLNISTGKFYTYVLTGFKRNASLHTHTILQN
jgi:hypothetical protein